MEPECDDSQGSGPDDADEEWNEWSDAEEDILHTKCLFLDETRSSPLEVVRQAADDHGFDLRQLKKTLPLDFYDTVRVINFVRRLAAENRDVFTGEAFPSREAALQHMAAHGHFRLPGTLDTGAGCHLVDEAAAAATWRNDGCLQPYLPDDPLLFSWAGEEEQEEVTQLGERAEQVACVVPDVEDMAVAASHDELAMLRLQNEMLQLQLATMEEDDSGDNEGTSTSSGSDSEEGGVEKGRAEERRAEQSQAGFGKRASGVGGAGGSRHAGGQQGAGEGCGAGKAARRRAELRDKRQVDKDYFHSYSMFGIHREMLSDKPRTTAYQSAILGNPQLLERAVVLDVGCGTGILSLFSAQAGAARVIGIDGSDRMAAVARQVARSNGLLREAPSDAAGAGQGAAPAQGGSGGVVEIIAGKVEEAALPLAPHSADVLISEWMGYCLLYESMLDSVLHARDTWLKPGGAILPDIFTMHMAGYGRDATPLPFWDDVYGFDMSTIGVLALADARDVAVVAHVEGQHLVTPAVQIQTIDLCTMSADDVGFSHEFRLTTLTDTPAVALSNEPLNVEENRVSPARSRTCYGVVIWFDSHFSDRFCPTLPVVLSTSPHAPPTHWAQTSLAFQHPVTLASATGERPGDVPVAIEGRISIAKSSVNYRSIDISLEYCTVCQDGSRGKVAAALYDM